MTANPVPTTPPGTTPPGTTPPGSLSPGSPPPGSLSPGSLSPGSLSPGSLSARPAILCGRPGQSDVALAHRVLRLLADLRITVVTLGLFMALVFVGTLAQVELGIWLVQARYFESWFVWKNLGGTDLPLMPGGYLLGAVLLVNLLAAHALRWKIVSTGRKRWMGFAWTLLGVLAVGFSLVFPHVEQSLEGGGPMRIILVCSALILPLLVGSSLLFGRRSGVVLIHVGLLVILGGEVATDVGSIESAMIIDEGGAVSYTEDQFATELAVVDISQPEADTVYSIPPTRLADAAETGRPIEHEAWPIRLRVDRYLPNARFVPASNSPSPHLVAHADRGLGVGRPIREVARATATDERDVPAAYLTLEDAGGETLGTWLVSSAFREAQPVTVQGQTLTLQMRPKRYPKPFTVGLIDFQHNKHTGTAIPSDFASVVRLTDPRHGIDREARIFMNHPLRYDGLTFYQASFANNDTTTILQVVKNPAWLLPYLACGLMSVGMLAQFGGHLQRFGDRRKHEDKKRQRSAAKTSAPGSPPGSSPGKPKHAGLVPPLSRTARWTPWIAAVLVLAYVGSNMRPVMSDTGFDLQAFGQLPVSHEGRVKPLDTVARSTLLTIYGKQSGKLAPPEAPKAPEAPESAGSDISGQIPGEIPGEIPGGGELSAMRWLMDVVAKPEQADTYRLFTIHDPDVLDLLSFDHGEKHFAYAQLRPHIPRIAEQGEAARELDAPQRTRYQRSILHLERNIADYQSLKYAFAPEQAFEFHHEVTTFSEVAGMMRSGRLPLAEAQAELNPIVLRYGELASRTGVLIVPPQTQAAPHQPAVPAEIGDWHAHGTSLQYTYITGQLDPAVAFFAEAREAYRNGDAARFNERLAVYRHHAAVAAFPKAPLEAGFNRIQPFAQAMALYVLALLLACVSWIKWPQTLGRTALAVAAIALVLHTLGLAARMWIEGRPPVTNLYSSAVFVGWGAVVLGVVLERLWKNGIGTATAAGVGFGTLIIAHHLSLGGDTMEAMRAVLDSNFWLGTHVVTITLGYSATFLAGFLAIVYVIRRALGSLNRPTADALGRMVYGILCFAVLLSFIGTVLGGIWGDQSWGRFWGWDPKENGALMIVIWNAIILHAKWGGIVKTRGVMLMAVFGNTITAFSWFGVNMLGVGLHAYGFMDAAFIWLILFAVSQFAVLGLGLLPPLPIRSLLRMNPTP